MNVELDHISPVNSNTAKVVVQLLLPGCKRRRRAECIVKIQGGVVVREVWSLDDLRGHVPKKLRERMGAAGREQFWAECIRLFIEAGGVQTMAAHKAKLDRQESQRRVRETTNSLGYAVRKLLENGLELAAIEDLVREQAVEKVMKS